METSRLGREDEPEMRSLRMVKFRGQAVSFWDKDGKLKRERQREKKRRRSGRLRPDMVVGWWGRS